MCRSAVVGVANRGQSAAGRPIRGSYVAFSLCSCVIRIFLHFFFQLLDAGLDPRVFECIFRGHALLRLPFKAVINKVNELILGVIALHQRSQLLRAYVPELSLRVWSLNRSVVVIEKDLASRSDYNHRSRRHPLHLHDALHLFFLVFPCKDGEAYV